MQIDNFTIQEAAEATGLSAHTLRYYQRIGLIAMDAGTVQPAGQRAGAWIWARSEKNIPILGFKTVAQVEENAKAMEITEYGIIK